MKHANAYSEQMRFDKGMSALELNDPLLAS